MQQSVEIVSLFKIGFNTSWFINSAFQTNLHEISFCAVRGVKDTPRILVSVFFSLNG